MFPEKGDEAKAWIFPLVVLILVAVGGIAAMGHLGRLAMMFNVLNNPTASITMEGASSGLLALVALIDLVLAKRAGSANRVLRIIGAVVGIVCMCVVTSAYVTSSCRRGGRLDHRFDEAVEYGCQGCVRAAACRTRRIALRLLHGQHHLIVPSSQGGFPCRLIFSEEPSVNRRLFRCKGMFFAMIRF